MTTRGHWPRILLVMVALAAMTAPAWAEDDPETNCLDCDSMIITGNAADLARGLEVKRASDTVVDAASAMDIGAFADRTADISLSRVAGTSTMAQSLSGYWPAPFSLASVRGLPWVAQTFNGLPVPRLVTAAFDSQRSLALAPGTPLTQISVNKTRTARMQEDGIGGTIDLRTMQPLDIGGGIIAAHLDHSFADPSGKDAWSASAIYSGEHYAAGNAFGWLVAVDWRQDRARRDLSATTIPSGAMAFGRTDIAATQLSLYTALQWRPNDNWQLTWTSSTARNDSLVTAPAAAIDLHLRTTSSAVNLRYNASDHWMWSGDATFAATRAGRDLAQQWTYNADGSYDFDADNRLSFGWRGTNGKTTSPVDPSLSENTYAGYIQAELQKLWGDVQLSGNAGVRIVRTETASGPTGIAPPDTAYTSVLPSINAKASLTDDFQLRLAFSQSILRPSARQPAGLLPATAFDDGAGYRGQNPMRSDNFDLGAEYYFGQMSAITLGLFHKDLHHLFAGGGGHLDGVEAGWQHQFDALPFPLDIFNYGLSTRVNYTLLSSSGFGAEVPGLARHIVNAALYYEHDEVWLRLAYQWKSGAVFTSALPVLAQPGSVESGGALDGEVYYTVFDRYRLGLAVTNMLGDDADYDAGLAALRRRIARGETGRTFTLSLHTNW